MKTSRIKDLTVGDQFIMQGGAYHVCEIQGGRLKYTTVGGFCITDISSNSSLIVELLYKVPLKPRESSFADLVGMYSKDPEKTFEVFSSLVAKEFIVSTEDLRSRNRKPDIVQARSAAMYLFATYTSFDHETISLEFNMDRTSVINAVHRAKKLMERSKDFRESLQEITTQLKRKAA